MEKRMMENGKKGFLMDKAHILGLMAARIAAVTEEVKKMEKEHLPMRTVKSQRAFGRMEDLLGKGFSDYLNIEMI